MHFAVLMSTVGGHTESKHWLEKSGTRPYCTDSRFGCIGEAVGRCRIQSLPPCSSMPCWLAAGELTFVTVPSVEHEQLRVE